MFAKYLCAMISYFLNFWGLSFQVSFTITNSGGPITETSWTDAIYVSSSNTFTQSSSDLVGELQRIGALLGGESYTQQVRFRIPVNWVGDLYVFLLFDSSKSVQALSDSQITSDTPNVVQVEALEFPDLALSFTSENISLSSGEPFVFEYEVTNVGEGPTLFPWFDAIYLSDDAIVDPFDLKLKTVINNDILNPGDTKTVNEEVSIPFDITTPSLYFIVEVDVGGRLFDTNEDNNRGWTLATVKQAFTSDISVQKVRSDQTLEYESSFTVEWALRNEGVENVEGFVCDTGLCCLVFADLGLSSPPCGSAESS